MSTLTATLWISLISIVLLFAAMAVLWGLMALMARIPAGAKEEEATPDAIPDEDVPTLADTPLVSAKASKQKAAALAVAVALAVRQSAPALVMTHTDGDVSPWQAMLRAGRMSQRSQIFVRKARG
jgi:flagellar basal body-associated protein FliL